ncbi:DUF6907 domain-containing protein [Streptomyces sp. NPDC001118]
MSAARTVTVHTADHGDVTLPEPSWCLGQHPAEGYREDIEHQGEPVRLLVDTACHGQAEVLTASLFQRPFSTHGPTGPMVTVELDDWHEFTAASLAGFADSLVSFAVGPLNQLAERLRLLEAGAS